MEKVLSKELASELKTQISSNEDWLIKRILYYAKKQGYTAYTSTLEEAWRASIAGLSKPLLETPSTSFYMLELHPHYDFMSDEYAAFGVIEAQKHRERGIDLIMFMGLFKYYRQTFEDLLFKVGMQSEDIRRCRMFLKRYFDRVEIGFLDEWTKKDTDGMNRELQDANRRVTNEKSLYLTTLESLRQPVLVVNSDCETIVMNQSAAELFAGYSSPGAVYYGGQRPDIQPSIRKKIKEFLGGYKESKVFTHFIDKQIFEVTFSRMKDVSGKFIGLAVIFNDITEKRRAESVLEESEIFRRALMEGIDAAALVVDTESKTVVDFNTKAEKLFASHITEKGFSEDCPKFYEELGGEGQSIFALSESSVSNEVRLLDICTNGLRPVRIFTMQVWFSNRRHKIFIIFDITREKMLEKRANHLQQLEVLGDIAGSLPHMLKDSCENILHTMEQLSGRVSSSESLMGLMPAVAKALGDADYVNEIVDALASIVQYEMETAYIDMNQLVKNCLVLTRNKWNPYADIDVKMSSDRRNMLCQPDEMGQVFLNLLVNAAYAVRKKFEADGERGFISVKSKYLSGYYELNLSDTGIGIKKQDYKRIFDQGFTTKEVGRVTGNGLAIVYDIVVRRYGGTIEFKSEVGKGTEFTIRLPL